MFHCPMYLCPGLMPMVSRFMCLITTLRQVLCLFRDTTSMVSLSTLIRLIPLRILF